MKQGYKILAILRSDDQRNIVESALSSVNGVKSEVVIGDFQTNAPRIVNGSVPDLLLVDVAFDQSVEMNELSHLIREHSPEMSVIATAPDVNIDGVRRLMRMGVSDFLPQPINPVDIRGAIDAAASKQTPRPSTNGKIFSFIRSCGGAGATTIAIEAAANLLSKGGRDREKNRVCLIDFDLQLGNIAVALDLQTNVGLGQIIENPDRLDDEFMMGAVSHHASGLDVLAAPESIMPLEAMTPDIAEQIIYWARRYYDYVVIDTPHSWTSWTGYVLGASDLITLVTEISVTAMQRCKRHFEILVQQELEDVPLAIVVNRFKQTIGGKNRAKQAERALGRQIDFFIRSDVNTANAARDQGVLLQDIKKRSPIRKDINKYLVDMRAAIKQSHEAPVVPVMAPVAPAV